MHKFEPHSSHHILAKHSTCCTCTVKHCPVSPYWYLYHLSDEMQHDHAITAAVVEHILSLDALPHKSDNCSTQHKSKYLFSYLAMKNVQKN